MKNSILAIRDHIIFKIEIYPDINVIAISTIRLFNMRLNLGFTPRIQVGNYDTRVMAPRCSLFAIQFIS